MYRIYRKILDSFQGDLDFFVKKWYILEELLPILRLISWSLPDDEGGITCMIGLLHEHLKTENQVTRLNDFKGYVYIYNFVLVWCVLNGK